MHTERACSYGSHTQANDENSNSDSANTPTHAHMLYVNCNKNIHIDCTVYKIQIEMETYKLFIHLSFGAGSRHHRGGYFENVKEKGDVYHMQKLGLTTAARATAF